MKPVFMENNRLESQTGKEKQITSQLEKCKLELMGVNVF